MNALHHRSALGSIGLLLVAGLAACGSDNTPDAATDAGVTPTDVGVTPTDVGATPADAGDTPSDAAVTRTSATIAGEARVDGEAVSNAVVTVVDRAGAMMTTGADGRFSFTLPIGSAQLLRMTHASARTIQVSMTVPMDDPTDFALDSISNGEIAAFYTGPGLTEDTTKGILLLHFNTLGTAPPGFGAMLNVAGGTRLVVPDSGPRQQDTSLGGDSPFIIVNVPTGSVTVTPTAPAGLSCVPQYGTATVRVDARAITEVNFTCR